MKNLILAIIAMSALLVGFSPVTTVVPGTSTWTEICNTGRLGSNGNAQFKVHNVGANPFTDCRVRSWVGPDADDYKDIDIAWTECLTLAADASSIWEIAGNSHEIIIVEVKAAVATSAYCRPYGN